MTDRFNLYKSTFIFDKITDKCYRLNELKEYIKIPEVIPLKCKIFNKPDKYFLFKKINKKRNHSSKRQQSSKLIKLLTTIKKKCNFQNCLNRHYPDLLIQIDKILLKNGNSTSSKFT